WSRARSERRHSWNPLLASRERQRPEVGGGRISRKAAKALRSQRGTQITTDEHRSECQPTPGAEGPGVERSPDPGAFGPGRGRYFSALSVFICGYLCSSVFLFDFF